MHKANRDRAESARAAMDAADLHDDPEGDVGDMLANLRHYCDQEELDFDHLVERSAVHHEAEKNPDDIELSSRAAARRRRR